VSPVEISQPEQEKISKEDDDIEQVVDSENTQTSSRELKKESATVSTRTAVKPPQVEKKEGATLSTRTAAKPLQVEKKKSKPSTASTSMSSISTGDEIRCPSCGQRLKVPYDRRPITAKCPRCQSKFMAEKQ
jgi:DNA-directed RNA polymerase subunit RPC12/RpoP